MNVELETQRLRLRQWRESDLEPFRILLGRTMHTIPRWRLRRRYGMAPDSYLHRALGFARLRSLRHRERPTGDFVGYAGPWFPYGKPEREVMGGLTWGA